MPDPVRPDGVPAGAVYFPPADTFDPVVEHLRARADRRGYLRAWVPFFIWRFHGVMLRHAGPRMLGINRRGWSMGRALIWSDRAVPVPGVWVWSLADERAEREAADEPAQ